MTLIQILRSNVFAIYVAIASVIVQSFHSFYAFYKISSLNGTGWGIAQAVLFALIVDCAVLFYTVRKNTKVTWMFAFVMVLINLYVYYTHLHLTFDFILGVLISFVIPVSNYFYSEEIDDTMEVDYEPEQREEVLKLEKENELLTNKLADSLVELIAEKDKATKYITELREEIKKRDEQMNRMVPLDNPDFIIERDGEKYVKSPIDGALLKAATNKGFASLKSPAQEETPPQDKSIHGIEKIIATDRPNKE